MDNLTKAEKSGDAVLLGIAQWVANASRLRTMLDGEAGGELEIGVV
jgi:hypothetical protein